MFVYLLQNSFSKKTCLLTIPTTLPVKRVDMIEIICLKFKPCFLLDCMISLIHEEFYNPYKLALNFDKSTLKKVEIIS